MRTVSAEVTQPLLCVRGGNRGRRGGRGEVEQVDWEEWDGLDAQQLGEEEVLGR